jgi:hypothetical protein
MFRRQINKLEADFKNQIISSEKFQDLASSLHVRVHKKRTKTQRLKDDRMLRQLELEEEKSFERANRGLPPIEESEDSASDIDPEEEIEKTLAENRIPLPICAICKQVMEQTFLYYPCGHAGCEECLTNWYECPQADRKCHKCKREVKEIIQMFPTETKTREQILLQQEQDEMAEDIRRMREEQEQDEIRPEPNNDLNGQNDDGDEGKLSY